MAGISVGHEQRIRSDGGAVSAKDSDLMVGEIERLRLRVLEEAHAALAQRPRQSNEKLARTKAAAEAIDHATGVKSLGGTVASLQLSCGKNLEERRAGPVGGRAQRPPISLFPQTGRGLPARPLRPPGRPPARAPVRPRPPGVGAVPRLQPPA